MQPEFTQFSGRFSSFNNPAQTLSLSGLTAGQSYTLSFDLYVLDSWDGTNPSGGPDQFEVSADGTLLMRDAFSNASLSNVQTYNASAGVRLQIVPTLTGMTAGRAARRVRSPGSGFMEGASTITIGGKALADSYTNQSEFDVFGTRNSDYRIEAPLTLDGPIKVTTEGGFATLPGPCSAPSP